MNTMKALVYHGPRNVKLETRTIPIPKAGEVLIKTRAVSICGSDLGAYRLHEVSDRWMPPIVLGHEFSGDIAALGEGVTGLKIGQRVAANPILYCGECYYCKRGMINLCGNRHSLGTSIGGSATDGAMQEYFTIRQEAIIPLDERVTYEQGALLEPLAVCLCAARNGSFGEGERVAVIGAGPIGLMIVKFLKALGAGMVIVSDILDERLKFADKYGADATTNAKNESVPGKVLQLTDGVGVDRVIVAGGGSAVMDDSLKMVRNGGNIVLVALIHKEFSTDPIKIVGRGISIIGSYMFTTEQKDVMELIATKQVHVDDIITSKYSLEECEGLFDKLCSPDCKDVKVLVMP